MDEHLRKRLEEAAEEYAESQDYVGLGNSFLMDNEGNSITQIYTFEQIKDAYEVGAEHGYKEAIAQCKAWLRSSFFQCLGEDDNIHWDSSYYDVTEALESFEADMLKLWEE